MSIADGICASPRRRVGGRRKGSRRLQRKGMAGSEVFALRPCESAAPSIGDGSQTTGRLAKQSRAASGSGCSDRLSTRTRSDQFALEPDLRLAEGPRRACGGAARRQRRTVLAIGLVRARLVRVMKTAASIREKVQSNSLKRLVATLVKDLLEIMPELREVGAWNTVGTRRELNELGQVVERQVADEVFQRRTHRAMELDNGR